MCCGPLAAELEEEADTAVGGNTLQHGEMECRAIGTGCQSEANEHGQEVGADGLRYRGGDEHT